MSFRKDMLRYGTLVILAVIFIAGLSVIIITAEIKYDGECMVSAVVEWKSSKGSSVNIYVLNTSSASCSFIMGYHGLAVAVCFVFFIYFILLLRKVIVNPRFLPWFALLCIIAAVFSLVCVMVLYIGLSNLCDGFLERYEGYTTCEAFESSYHYDRKGFTGLFKGAQIASWLSCVFWAVMALMLFAQRKSFRIRRSLRVENSIQT
ncbi:uncharacterized protein [Antedon mediterranea]|uniref:uncharacterized protein n=1 Tax=Antedon mediterranea TaxID=105859 RepID=UPI003AF870C6